MKKISKFLQMVSIVILFGGFFFGSFEVQAQIPVKAPPIMKLNDPLPSNLFVELGKVINPTVVNISTSAISRGMRPRDPMMDLLEKFYGFQGEPPEMKNRPHQIGLGTGFIIREDGLIVTNNHVIEGADIVNVQLTEKSDKLYEAKVIGSDRRADIALIKINADGKLPTAALGNSSQVQVGEWVAAFGNPFGHGHTMTKGIISSKGRAIEEINKVPLFQTDASINPGNSGGPLVDTKGYVIGVNSAIDARAQGIGFAIPIDEVKKILPDLETRGSIRQGYLGVYLGDHSNESSSDLGLEDKNRGAVVIKIERDSPAAKGGLRPYDTILEFNGRKIKNSTDLSDTVSDAKIGEKVKLKVLSQNRKSRQVEIVIGERQDPKKKAAQPQSGGEKGLKVPHGLGFSVGNLTDELREDFGYSSEVIKPIIVSMDRESLGGMGGLRVGDLILEVNKVEVTTANDVIKAVKKDTNTFRVARGNRILIVTISK
jgi:serine protease Do